MSGDLTLSNSLADLAARIRVEHEAHTVAMKRSLAHAIEAGELLIEAKAQLKHGQWLPWLGEHCAMSDRTARLYMRLARNRAAIERNGSVADLSLRGAVELLTPVEPDDDVAELPPIPLADGEFFLPIDEVKFRADLYPRTESAGNQEVVDRYRHFLRELPAIELNQRHELIDGWYRWQAHRRAGASTIRVFITEVANDLEHLCFAIKRNATHALQLDLDDEIKLRDERRVAEKLAAIDGGAT
jgi:hypothetical protein